jgi:hypothetical protein
VAPVSTRRRLALTPLLIAPILTIAACGGNVVDARKLEAAVKAETMVKTDTKIKSVECPTDLSVIPGSEFTCTVTAADGVEATADLEILNDDADVDFIRLSNP